MLLQISLTGNNLNLLEAEWTFVGPLDCICCPFPATSQLLSTAPCNMPHDFSPLGSCSPVLEVGLRALPEIFLQKRPNLFFLFVWKTLLVHHLAKNDLAIGPCCSVLGVCEFAALSWEGSECRVKTMVAHLLYNFGQDIQLPCSALL